MFAETYNTTVVLLVSLMHNNLSVNITLFVLRCYAGNVSKMLTMLNGDESTLVSVLTGHVLPLWIHRENALQNADDDDKPKASKRKAAKDEDEEAVGNKRPAKRVMTFKDHAAERVKLSRTVFVGNLPVSCTKGVAHS